MMHQKSITIWLYSTCILILAMIALGGVTRLEGAGLSMVSWRPLTGWLPPLTQSAWDQAFGLYKTSPEFKQINFMFSLSDFKTIFWLEYLHRLLGRLMGLVFFVPGVFFWIKGWLTQQLKRRFVGMLLLGGSQGLMGWYMVKSGLVDQPHVSPYRLAGHLFLALALYVWIFWTALSLNPKARNPTSSVQRLFLWLLVPLTLTIFYGALVAGLKAGLIYNTFPLMNGTMLPEDGWALMPWYKNLFENPAMVQFIHRWLACGTAVVIFGACVYAKRTTTSPALKRALLCVQLAILMQVALGIATLLTHVPTTLAILHQLGAVAVLTGMVWVVGK